MDKITNTRGSKGKNKYVIRLRLHYLLIKLKQLRDDALIYEDKIALTGITGHKIYTIGKMYTTIELELD